MNDHIKSVREEARYIALVSRQELKYVRPIDAELADLVESFGQAADAVVEHIKSRSDK